MGEEQRLRVRFTCMSAGCVPGATVIIGVVRGDGMITPNSAGVACLVQTGMDMNVAVIARIRIEVVSLIEPYPEVR